MFQNRLRLNLAIFQDDYSDVQRSVLALLVPPSTTATVVTNATKARLRGIEADVQARLVKGFTLTGSVGYLDPEYISFTDFTGDRSNEPWPAPHWNYQITGNLTQPVPFGALNASATWQWQSDTYPSAGTNALIPGGQKIASYGLLSGRIGVEFEGADLSVELFGRNLLNKNYYSTGINLEPLGFDNLFAGEPRTYGIQITKKFGHGI